METTTTIEIRPPKKIVIHNVIQMNLETIIKSVRTPAGNMPLMWANGFVFILSAIPLQSKALDLYVEGEMHFTDVIFCAYANYQPTIKINEFEDTNIMDMSNSVIHNVIAQAFIGLTNANAPDTPK